jgi:hypothetical protein
MTNDWWSKKLSQPNVPSVPPVAPPQPVPYSYTKQNTPVSYDPSADQLVTKATSARQVDRCPGCNSGNYMAPQGTSLKRCYDCGYPLVQSGTGSGIPTDGAPARPAKQPAVGSGFNPNVIVERLG